VIVQGWGLVVELLAGGLTFGEACPYTLVVGLGDSTPVVVLELYE
jgi:hypothetical protein